MFVYRTHTEENTSKALKLKQDINKCIGSLNDETPQFIKDLLFNSPKMIGFEIWATTQMNDNLKAGRPADYYTPNSWTIY
jgi:hypothetical protein